MRRSHRHPGGDRPAVPHRRAAAAPSTLADLPGSCRACAAGLDGHERQHRHVGRRSAIRRRPIAFEAALASRRCRCCRRRRSARIRICANCRWLFLDEAATRSRVWCDMAVCGNRQKARRHYQRRRQAAEDARWLTGLVSAALPLLARGGPRACGLPRHAARRASISGSPESFRLQLPRRDRDLSGESRCRYSRWEGETAVATFENPAGGEPIVVRQKIWPKLDKTTIESPPLQLRGQGPALRVSIRIEDADGTAAADDRDDDDLVAGPDHPAGQAAGGRARSTRPIRNLPAIPTASCRSGRRPVRRCPKAEAAS